MRFRHTLLARILGAFLLNLLVVGLVLWGLYEFRVGPGSELAGLSEDRVRQAAAALSDQLIQSPRAEWPALLERHNKRHDVRFQLRDARGQSLTDTATALPKPVTARLAEVFPAPPASRLRRHLERQMDPLQLNAQQLNQVEAIWLDSLRLFQSNQELEEAIASYERRIREVLSQSQWEEFARRAPAQFIPRVDPGELVIAEVTPAELHARFDADGDGDLNATELGVLLASHTPPGARPGRGTLPEEQATVHTFTQPGTEVIWAALEIPVRVRGVSSEFSSWDVMDLRPTPDGQRFHAVLLLRSDPVLGKSFFAEPWPWVTILLLIIGLSTLFWLPLVSRITRPLAKVTALTEEIAEGKFANRVELEQPDEIGRLAQAVDQMAQRLESLVGGQRRFLGDVSHELCAPLARLQMALGVLAENATSDQKEMLEDLREEVDQMATLVDELLCFTRTGEAREVQLEAVLLAPMIRELAAREASGLDAEMDVPVELTAHAAPDRLERALANILRNAQQHAGSGGCVDIRAELDGDQIELRIRDHGPGVPADTLDRLFDPFYRPEDARTRETGGTGLGLAIAKSAIESCGGRLHCRLPEDGGLEFILRLASA